MPESFARALEQALNTSPNARFASALEFQEAVCPATLSRSAQQLARLVREVCGEQVKTLEHLCTQVQASASGIKTVPFRRTHASGILGVARFSWQKTSALALTLLLVGLSAVALLPEGDATPLSVAADQGPPSGAIPTAAVPGPLTAESAAEAQSSTAPENVSRTAAPVKPAAAPVPARRRVSKKPEFQMGWVSIDAIPWASVRINEHEVGQTPIGRYPVAAGKVALVLEGPDGQIQRRILQVRGGEEARVRVDIRRARE